MSENKWIEYIISPPRLVVLSLFMIIIVISLVYPLGLPIQVSSRVTDTYNSIEKLDETDVVLYVFNIGAGLHTEAGPAAGAALTHIFRQNAKVMFVSLAPDGPMLLNLGYGYGWQDRPEEYGYVYGDDYVELGYLPGGETALAKMGQDLHEAYPKDVQGTPIEQIPMMANIRNANDITYVFSADTGVDPTEATIRQFPSTYPHIGMSWAGSAQMETSIIPYYPNPVEGTVGGIRGAAEYEILIKRPARGSKFTDVLSLTQTYALVLLIGGNVAFLIKRTSDKEKGVKD